jgi:hypothetical protein
LDRLGTGRNRNRSGPIGPDPTVSGPLPTGSVNPAALLRRARRPEITTLSTRTWQTMMSMSSQTTAPANIWTFTNNPVNSDGPSPCMSDADVSWPSQLPWAVSVHRICCDFVQNSCLMYRIHFFLRGSSTEFMMKIQDNNHVSCTKFMIKTQNIT